LQREKILVQQAHIHQNNNLKVETIKPLTRKDKAQDTVPNQTAEEQ